MRNPGQLRVVVVLHVCLVVVVHSSLTATTARGAAWIGAAQHGHRQLGSSVPSSHLRVPLHAASSKQADGGGVEVEPKPQSPSASDITQPIPPRSSDAVSEPSKRGKVNEIDFCIAPADVSLSRAYGAAATTGTATAANDEAAGAASATGAATSSPETADDAAASTSSSPLLSLTRALNNASNRAVRRILLARSWPSAEALNLSLRLSAAAEKERELTRLSASAAASAALSPSSSSEAKCPIPRPILNVLMRKRRHKLQQGIEGGEDGGSGRDGDRSNGPPVPRSRTNEEYVADQIRTFRERYGDLTGYAYAESYLEAILNLATAGIESPDVEESVIMAGVYDESYKRVIAVLKSVGVVFETDPETGRQKIGEKLLDQDICLSMMDKLRMRKENEGGVSSGTNSAPVATSSYGSGDTKDLKDDADSRESEEQADVELTKQDLGGVLLSAEEPSVTRQLNVLSNIAQRALLFGGDQELLVLADTLEADRSAFVERWYPNTGGISDDYSPEDETRHGVQFLNCLVRLLRECYDNGVVVSLEPPLPLSQSYANSYERLVAGAVELGSGYLKPLPSNVMGMPKPRTAKEELGRFAVWESAFRQSSAADVSSYPEDLEGVWEVRDEIGGETIGTSLVTLQEQGAVEVAPPLEGLRWRLDPGPTHLDTCTFQVLSSDGTILQYRGFIDRGARLESRFSRRPIRIRGSVMFQMRDGSVDYYKDMLPINYRTGNVPPSQERSSKEITNDVPSNTPFFIL